MPYLSNGLTNRHEIWHIDAFWPSWPFRPLKIWNLKNARWRRLPPWKIEKLPTVWSIATKVGTVTHIVPLHPTDSYKFELLKIEDGGRPPSGILKSRGITVTVLSITAEFGTITHFDHLHRIDRYSAVWAKSYRISHIILADHSRKKPKENISAYNNIILGNSNVLLASNLRKSVHTSGFCGSGWHFIWLLPPFTHIQISSHTHWLIYAADASCSFSKSIRCIILCRMTR